MTTPTIALPVRRTVGGIIRDAEDFVIAVAGNPNEKENPALSALIVRAVNHHDVLVAALDGMVRTFIAAYGFRPSEPSIHAAPLAAAEALLAQLEDRA